MAWQQLTDMDGGAGGWYNSETKQFSPGWTDPATGRVYPEQPTTGVSATSGGQVRPNGWTYQPATHGTMDSQGDEQPGYWWNQQGQKWAGDENTPPPVDSLTNLGRVQEGNLNGFLQQGSDGKYYISGKPEPITSYQVNGQTIPLDAYHVQSMLGSTATADAQSVASGKRSDMTALALFGGLAGAGALGLIPGTTSAFGAVAGGAGLAGSEFAYGGAQALPAVTSTLPEFAYGGAQTAATTAPSVANSVAPALTQSITPAVASAPVIAPTSTSTGIGGSGITAGQALSGAGAATTLAGGSGGGFTDAMGTGYATQAEADAANMSYGLSQSGDPIMQDGSNVDPSTIAKIAQATGMTEAAVKALGGAAIGALAGSVGANSKPAGTTTTTQDIPDWLKPYVVSNLDAAQAYMTAHPQDNSLLAPASAQLNKTIAGDYLNSNPANPFYTGAMNYQNTSADYLKPTASGAYLNKNPYIDAMYQQALNPVLANIDSRFTSAGRYGSGADQAALGTAADNLATSIYGQNYANERSNMLSAGTTLTSADQAAQASRLAAANGLGTNYNTARNVQVDAATNAPAFTTQAATAPFSAFNTMGNLTKLGIQSTTTPYFTNPTGGALSGALAGYGLSKAFG